MIKKGTPCHYCDREEGQRQTVVLTKDLEGNFVCPWCLASHPDLSLAQTKHALASANAQLKDTLRTFRKTEGVIKKQREVMNIQHECILLIQGGEVEKGLKIYADFFGGEKHESN